MIGIDHQRALHRLLEGIENTGSDLLFIVNGSTGNFLRGVLRHVITLACTPVRIEHVSLDTRIQLGDLLAAGLIRIPAVKHKGAVCRNCPDLRHSLYNKALHLDLGFATVGIKLHIAICSRSRIFVNTVQIHIGFDQTAAHQAEIGLVAVVAPLGKGEHEVIAGPAFDHSRTQGAGLVEPAAATVKGQRQQRVKLALRQGQLELVSKFVDLSAHGLQELCQQSLCLFPRNTVGLVFLQLVIRNSCAVANSPLGMIPIGILAKAFKFLQQIDHFFAGLKFRCRAYGDRCQGDQRNQQRNSQSYT